MNAATSVTELCESHLDWARSFVARKAGQAAAEHAAVALFTVARSFDPSRNVPFRAWASMRLVSAACREARKEAPEAAPILDNDKPVMPLPTYIDRHEQMAHAVRTIDAMPAPQRWVVMARFLADWTTADIAQAIGCTVQYVSKAMLKANRDGAVPSTRTIGSRSPRGVWFESMDDLIDGAMLFGAGLRTSGNGHMTHIAIERQQSTWPALVWMVATLERHGVPMSLGMGTRGSVIALSKVSPLMAMSRRRWYADGRRAMPAVLALTKAKLACWLLGGLAGHKGEVLKLSMQGAGSQAIADEIRRISGLETVPGHAFIEVRSSEAAGDWLQSLIPRSAWEHRTTR